MQISHLLLSIILILSSSCIEFRPKTKQNTKPTANEKVLISSKSILTLDSDEYLSNKIDNNIMNVNEQFQHGDEIELTFTTYRYSLDSIDIKSEIIRSSPFDNGFFQGTITEFNRIYDGIQLSDVNLFDNTTADLLKNGISIQFSNNQEQSVVCSLTQLGVGTSKNTIRFSLVDTSNCENLNQILDSKSSIKLSIINNLALDEKIKVVNNGNAFTDKKVSSSGVTHEVLYENLEINEINTEVQIRFKATLNRYK